MPGLINLHVLVGKYEGTFLFALAVPQVPAVGEVLVFKPEGSEEAAVYRVTDVEWFYEGEFHHLHGRKDAAWDPETLGFPEARTKAMIHVEEINNE